MHCELLLALIRVGKDTTLVHSTGYRSTEPGSGTTVAQPALVLASGQLTLLSLTSSLYPFISEMDMRTALYQNTEGPTDGDDGDGTRMHTKGCHCLDSFHALTKLVIQGSHSTDGNTENSRLTGRRHQ